MERRDESELRDLMQKFLNEAEKTDKLIEALRERAIKLVHKGEHILIPEIKQNVRKQAIAELEEITEKLVSINIDLELDCLDCPLLVIPYFTPGDTIYKLKFLSGDSPWSFWLVDNNVDTKVILKNLLHKFQNNLLEPVKKPKAAQSVCFIDRNKVIRGIILQIKSENRIKLVDCDSNVTKVVATDKLYEVDEETCSIHASALRCTITEEPDAVELWNHSDLRDMFCNTLREATLGVKIIKRVAGSFPIFVVDIELHNEEEGTASLREWILDRLLPELKKLETDKNEPICDYLSEEYLSPFYKTVDQKVHNKVPQLPKISESSNTEIEVHSEELNNLNYPNDKLSEKIVTHVNVTVEENAIKEIINKFANKVSESSEGGIVSSSSGDDIVTSSSKESLVSDVSHKSEPMSDSKLNCNSQEFRPKSKRPDIPRLNRKYQNRKSPPRNDPLPVGFAPQQISPNQPWSYAGPPLQQNSWSCPQSMPQPPMWLSSQSPAFSANNKVVDSNNMRSNEVNAMAPEFVPRNINAQYPQASNRIEFTKEPIVLRKSATLIKENENLLVMISHVETPSEFYVHFVNQNNKYLDKLYEDMFSYYAPREKLIFDSWRDARTKLGKHCACKWPRDNHWYRVEVMDWAAGVNNQDNLVKVWFVDYGNTECLPLTNLQPLVKMFEKLPICSQACHLAEVHPMTKGQPWSEEAVEFFKSKVEVSDSRVYSITVVRSSSKAVKPNSFSVLLYEGKATDSSKSVNDLLVENGLAWSRQLQSEVESSLSSENFYSMDDLSDKSNKLPSLDSLLPIPTLDTNKNSAAVSLFSEPNPLLQAASDLLGPELDEDFDQWDPRKEDYESARNNPAVDTDDACVAVSGYSARDEARICKFYYQKGFCFKTVCYKEHSRPNPDGTTTDKEEVYVGAFSQLELPIPGEIVKLRITFVFDMNLFYAQIEEKKGISVDDHFEEEAETLSALEEYMNRPENVTEMRGLTVAPAPGEMVLAREVNEDDGSEWWYRARVITASDDSPDDNPEVMFVDYGTTCTVSEKDLRKIEKRYLHLPFQAIECSLANITPLENDSEDSKRRSAELLQELLLGQVLTAKVYKSINKDSFQLMELVLESREHGDVGKLLIAKGYATENQLNWYQATASACAPLTIYPG